MAYSIYQTDAIVLGIQHIQENDILLRLFSPMFGYMRVIAKGARRGSSKLRANIQEYAIVHLAAVKGKEFFILTDIRCVFSFIQSRSIVDFIKRSESLFYDDENEHGGEVNQKIYTLFKSLLKLLVYMIAEKKEKKDLDFVYDFFFVYVKSLQGFMEKFYDGPIEEIGFEYIKNMKSYIENGIKILR